MSDSSITSPGHGEVLSGAPIIVGLGEILWDILPSGRLLGGAPTNFAYMTSMLGDCGVVASRVGNDSLGQEAAEAMQKAGLFLKYLQRDEVYETGYTTVSLDNEGQPTFIIKEPVAWDNLQWTVAWQELAARADVICFGSLAQRSAISAATIARFVTSASDSAIRIFDVNLRAPFFTSESLLWSFRHADIVKLNEHEIVKVASLFGFQQGDELALSRQLLEKFRLRLVCLTRGARGSLLVSGDQVSDHAGIRVKVADAIGAGDAFTACLAHHYIRNRPLDEIAEAANQFASWVTTQVGATPMAAPAELLAIQGLSGHVQ